MMLIANDIVVYLDNIIEYKLVQSLAFWDISSSRPRTFGLQTGMQHTLLP